MMGLLSSKSYGLAPQQQEWIEKARVIRDWWFEKLGNYSETECGVEDTTFTELNERRAESRVEEAEHWIALGGEGKLTQRDKDYIAKAYTRVPKFFKP